MLTPDVCSADRPCPASSYVPVSCLLADSSVLLDRVASVSKQLLGHFKHCQEGRGCCCLA